MSKIKIYLNWGLFPEVNWKWGLPIPPSRPIEVDFPTPFYKEAFDEIIEDGGKANLINIQIDDKEYRLTFDGNKLELQLSEVKPEQ